MRARHRRVRVGEWKGASFNSISCCEPTDAVEQPSQKNYPPVTQHCLQLFQRGKLGQAPSLLPCPLEAARGSPSETLLVVPPPTPAKSMPPRSAAQHCRRGFERDVDHVFIGHLACDRGHRQLLVQVPKDFLELGEDVHVQRLQHRRHQGGHEVQQKTRACSCSCHSRCHVHGRTVQEQQDVSARLHWLQAPGDQLDDLHHQVHADPGAVAALQEQRRAFLKRRLHLSRCCFCQGPLVYHQHLR